MFQFGRILYHLIKAIGILILIGGTAFAEKRVALVIGNSNYQNVSELANPKNDAKAVTASLKRLGFEVISGLDVDRPAFMGKIRDFSRALRGAKVALLFYAGHGLQVGGANYLAPVETQLSNEEDLDFETIRLRMIMSQMEREPRTNLVFLDACRDNPLARNLARSMGTRSASIGRGLAPIDTGVGTLIAFATQPGNVALDGDTKNSPFTESLVKHIETPGVDIAVLLRRVRQDVIKSTDGKQVPWSNSSLTGDVVLKTKPEPVEVVKPKPDNSFELAYWDSIKNGNEPSLFEAYLKRYPEGAFSDLASIRLKTLKQKDKQALKPKLPDNSAEIAYWNSIKDSKDPAVLELYLKQFPNGIYTGLTNYRLSLLNDLHKQRLAITKQKKPDNTAQIAYWNSIKDGRDPSVLELYLKRYPKGIYAELAGYRISLLKEMAKQKRAVVQAPKQADNSIENSYWESIKGSAGVGYYQSYLSRYPDGLYAEIAKLRIAELGDIRKATKLALLQSPKEDELKTTEQPPEVSTEITRNIQKELNRLGCSAGRPDGKWGKGSRRALKQYSRYGKVELASLEPSNNLLDQLKTKQTRICPLVCRSGFEKKNDKCVRIKREASIPKQEPIKKPSTTIKANENTKPKNRKKTARSGNKVCFDCSRANRADIKAQGSNYCIPQTSAQMGWMMGMCRRK